MSMPAQQISSPTPGRGLRSYPSLNGIFFPEDPEYATLALEKKDTRLVPLGRLVGVTLEGNSPVAEGWRERLQALSAKDIEWLASRGITSQ
jgi:hypothetical protein